MAGQGYRVILLYDIKNIPISDIAYRDGTCASEIRDLEKYACALYHLLNIRCSLIAYICHKFVRSVPKADVIV